MESARLREPAGDRRPCPALLRLALLTPVILLALLATAAPAEDEILLKRGDLLHGTILERGADYIVLEHADLGRMTISMSKIESIKLGRPVKPTPEGAPPPKPEGEVVARVPDKPQWNFNLVVGGVAKNNDDGREFDLNIRTDVERVTPVSESKMFLSYVYGDNDSTRDDNAFTGVLRQNFLSRRTPWLIFAALRYDWDEFRSWDYRWTAHGGIGYRVIDTETTRLILPKVGGGYRKDFGSEDEASRTEGLVGFELDWKPGPRNTIHLDVTYYPSLNENEYRLVPIAEWTFRFVEDSALSFNFRFEMEYATDPDPGFPRDTYRAIWGMQLDL